MILDMLNKFKVGIGIVVTVLIGWLTYKNHQQKDRVKDLEDELADIELARQAAELRRLKKEETDARVKEARTSGFDASTFDKSRMRNKD